jgi:hypothetical protein
MDEYKKQVTRDAEALVATEMPQRLAQVQALLAAKFASRQPSVVRSSIDATVRAELPARVALHGDLTALVGAVGDHVELALSDFQKLSQWIALQVPRVADGNNFGVEVQYIVLKELKEASEKLQKAWDSLPEYHSQRATAIEKIVAKPSSESSKTTTVTEAHGGKDGDETKTTTASVDKTATTTATPVDDWVANVVSIDVKWYFNLARVLENVRDLYAIVYDRIDKNKEKIALPRGNDRANYSMY